MLLFMIIFCVYTNAQYFHRQIATSNDSDATAYNNGHRICLSNGEMMSDTIGVYYHSSDSVYFIGSYDMGRNWQQPIALYRGKYPATDILSSGMRRLVWQQYDSTHDNYEIIYDCLDDTLQPFNISQSLDNSMQPDMAMAMSGAIRVAWVEEKNNIGHVYYRQYIPGLVGDTFQVSGTGDNRSPSITHFSSFAPYVVWSSYDSSLSARYQILYRYNSGSWSAIDTLAKNYRSLRHSSVDQSAGTEQLSACWEDSSSGNLEATFYGGNPGGGYPTYGRSQSPVMSTIGSTWSYLFWDEDSAGYRDIFMHFFYLSHWYGSRSLRALFGINETVRFPNSTGAYLVWTQGNSPPYDIYFADFGYPIGINESDKNAIYRLHVDPNPFNKITRIKCPTDLNARVKLCIYDMSGKLIKSFTSNSILLGQGISWNGKDDSGKELPNGVYFCRLSTDKFLWCEKIVKLQ